MGKKLMESLHLSGGTVALFNTLKEGNSIYDGLDECVDDAIEAVIANKEKRIVAINIEENHRNYKIYDNGIGQTPEELRKCYESFYNSNWKEHNYAGIRGFGRFVYLAIMADFTQDNCRARIISSVGDDVASIIDICLTNNEEVLTHPVYTVTKNDFENNDYNVINRKLKGTIVEIYNGEKLIIDEKEKIYIGARHRDAIFNKRVGIIINGEMINGIDITHDLNIVEKNKIICSNVNKKDSDKYATLFTDLKIYNKTKKSDVKILPIKCTVSLNIELTRKYCEWEKYFRFNEIGGIFVDYNGRLVEIGGNTQSHFKQNVDKGNTKTTGSYGDTVGGTAGYLRLTIFPSDKEMADVFGIRSVKSKGITPLADNDVLTNDYFVILDDGKEVSLFEAISHIRYLFSQIFYRNYIMPVLKTKKNDGITIEEINYEKASKTLNSYLKDYDFSTGKLKSISQRGRKKGSSNSNITSIDIKTIGFKFDLVRENGKTTVKKWALNKKSYFYKDFYSKLDALDTKRLEIEHNFMLVVIALADGNIANGTIKNFLTKYTEIVMKMSLI